MLRYSLSRLLSTNRTCRTSRKTTGSLFRIETLEDRIVPNGVKTLTVGSGYEYPTISSALAAAQSNAAIDVYPGVYNESVVVAKNGISLFAERPGVVIQPTTMNTVILGGTNVGGAAVDIDANNVTVSGFTVDGSKETDGNLWVGIRVAQGGSAVISNNTVENITNANTSNSDIGIDIGLSQVSQSLGAGSATVCGNCISAYEGAGVLVDGSAASASVQNNIVTGRGAGNNGSYEYGVLVSNGANASVEGNTITGNTLLGPSSPYNNAPVASAGVYLSSAGAKTSVTCNSISGNDDGVLVQQTNGTRCGGIEIANNSVQQSYGYAGIFVLSSSNVDVSGNTVSRNQTWNAVALNSSSNVTVKNNQIYSNGMAGSLTDGVYDLDGQCDQISCNNSSSNSGNGFNIQSCSGDTVTANVAKGNTLSGFQDLDGTNDSFWLDAGNGNSMDGMILTGTTGDAVIGNLLTQNTLYGLQLQGAANTLVALNATRGNGSGSISIDSQSTGTEQFFNLQ